VKSTDAQIFWHEVVFSYARGEQKLKRLARDAQRKAQAGTPVRAGRGAGVTLDRVALVIGASASASPRRLMGDIPFEIRE
jgi:hypothetical protein